MSRWNSNAESERNWKLYSSTSPYRASAGFGVAWSTLLPSPDMARCAKQIQNGRRLLLAFEIEEVRDYFVLSYIGEDVQKEDDWSETSSPRVGNETSRHPRTLQEACDALSIANHMEDCALQEIEGKFNKHISIFFNENRIEEGLQILKSIPTDCFMRTLGIATANQSGLWNRTSLPLANISELPLNKERATALLEWRKARIEVMKSEKALGDIVVPMANDMLRTLELYSLQNLVDTLPRCALKASIRDMIRQERLKAKQEPEGDDIRVSFPK